MNDALVHRVGQCLRRSPLVWLVATILLLFVMNTPLATVASDPGSGNVWLAAGAVGFAIYGVWGWFWLPRHWERRGNVTHVEERIAIACWAFALCPFLFTYAAALGGAAQWGYGVGFITSVALLVASARKIHRRGAGLSAASP